MTTRMVKIFHRDQPTVKRRETKTNRRLKGVVEFHDVRVVKSGKDVSLGGNLFDEILVDHV